MKRKIVKAASVITLAASMSLSSFAGYIPTMTAIVQAADTSYTVNNGLVSFGEGGASIKIQGNTGQALTGKKFRLYKLFSAENSEGLESINYTFNPLYQESIKKVVAAKLNARDGSTLGAGDVTEYMAIDYIQSLNHYKVAGAQTEQTLESSYSAFRYFIEDLRTQIVKDGVGSPVITVNSVDQNNAISINDLAYGYYLVDEITDNENTYQAASLCMVNTANPNAEVNIKSDYPSVVKKINEDDNKASVGNDGWNDLADYEIGQTVPYKYTSNVPDINGYQTYFYAWHDVMDDALTFDKDSVSITITDNKGGSYKLDRSEFSVIENTADGDTFDIAITDIKKIVDRQFNMIDSRGENTYGQTVTLTYNATVNNNAVSKTGRPGMENKVQLEFSNDSDTEGLGETGRTPWDTVVCFTYKLDVTKQNTADKVLRNAMFRLYSDAECKNEVYVQEVTGGYAVINRDSCGGTDHTGGKAPAKSVEMKSNDNGNFVIFGLDSGVYYLKETKAPAGYRQLLDPIVLNVSATYSNDRNNYIEGQGATDKILKAFDIGAHVKSFNDGKYTEEDQTLNTDVANGVGYLTVINKEGSKLPITGSNLTLIITAAGTVIILGSAAAYAKSRKKEKPAK